MTAAALIAAEKRHLRGLTQACPVTLTIGSQTLQCGGRPQTGVRLELTGATNQQRQMTVVVGTDALAASELLEQTGGRNVIRTRQVTHVETGEVYRIDPDHGVQRSTHGQYWVLRLNQETAA